MIVYYPEGKMANDFNVTIGIFKTDMILNYWLSIEKFQPAQLSAK